MFIVLILSIMGPLLEIKFLSLSIYNCDNKSHGETEYYVYERETIRAKSMIVKVKKWANSRKHKKKKSFPLS